VRTWSNTHREGAPPLLRVALNGGEATAVRLKPACITTPMTFQAAREFWFSKTQLFATSSAGRGLALRSEEGTDLVDRSGVEAPADQPLFRDKGEYWHIAYAGTAADIRAVKGLFYLQYLLLHPEEKIHVSNLAALGDHYWSSSGATASAAATSAQLGLGYRLLGDSGRVLDQRATQEYKSRLIDLRVELDEASQWADLERADSIRREIQFITHQLTAAYGRTGRARKIGDPMERVRKAVTNRIRDAIERVSKRHRSLGRHLDDAIRTGIYCCYSPENPIDWKS